MDARYSIGLDYGTLSLRGVLIDVADGRQAAEAVCEYAHGVMTRSLPTCDQRLPDGYALQDPTDYMEASRVVLGSLLRSSGVNPAQIIGIGLDTTASTIIPVDEHYTPLCLREALRDNPHAWIKLWKHHGAQSQADQLNDAARAMGLRFLDRVGGVLASEYAYPKILETLEEAPDVFAATYRFMEIGDWIVWYLTGEETRNAVIASFHMQWDTDEGFPPNAFFRTVHPGLDGLIERKIGLRVHDSYARAGGLTAARARETGLLPGTSVCCANGDGNIPLSCLDISREGVGALILGTSSVLMFLTREQVLVKGSMGVVNKVLLPGYYGHVFGQSAAGDALSWYMENMLPHKYFVEAEQRGVSPYALMDEKIAALPPGAGGLLALDWYNGCRSLRMDARLSSVIVGLRIQTSPEEIYHAMVESLAFGFRHILERCAAQGIELTLLRVCGGLARKNPSVVQIFADVLGKRLIVSDLAQTVSLGSAISGAVAAGCARGGYADVIEAGRHMSDLGGRTYTPRQAYEEAYDQLYAQFRRLSETFGADADMMHTLADIKANQ